MKTADTEEFSKELRDLSPEDRYQRLETVPIDLLVRLIASRWRSVGDYAWSVLHCASPEEKPKIFHLICDGFEAGLFRTVDARVRSLNFLVANAARDERAKAVYRRYLTDRSSGVASCAVTGSVWSLDDEAIPILRAQIETESSPKVRESFLEAIKAISKRDPRLIADAARDPNQWALKASELK